MKIAIDISPLHSAHKVRGVGFYLKHLKSALLQYHPEHKYNFFVNDSEVSSDTQVVHYPYFDPFFVTLPFVKKYKRVVTVHDLTPLVFPQHFPAGIKGNISWQIQKLNLKKSDAIITDSRSSTADVIKFTGIPAEKVHSVYLSAGEEFKKMENGKWKMEIFRKYNLPERFVLYVGDVTWNKNLPRLVKAIKQIDIPLVMVGKSLVQTDFDRTNSWNKDLVEVQSLTEGDRNFLKLGFVSDDDLIALYNTASVFVFPSLYEGFGLPVLEAMQCGLPVITTKAGSLIEISGDAAFFVNEKSVDDIASGIEKVFNNEDFQKTLTKKGFEQASQFSWKKTADETVKIYEMTVNKKQ